MTSYNLRKLLKPWISNVDIPECVLNGITLDSRTASIGDLFLAIAGHQTDGRRYITQAIAHGVSAVIVQSNNKSKSGKIDNLYGVPIIYFYDLQRYLSALAGRFYQWPSHELRLVGVTGTNGKTTTAHILSQWTHLLGETSAILGTIGNGILGNMHEAINTTSSSVEIQRFLAQLLKQGVHFTAMEVSSHGLQEHRVNDIHFAAAIFTNLSRDHLDYHGDMIRYELAKWRLFSELQVDQYIINIDDITGQRWLNRLPQAIAVAVNRKLPEENRRNWLCADKVYYHAHGTEISFRSSWGEGMLYSPLIGEFNVINLLLAFTTLLSLGYPLPKLVDSVTNLKSVCGRMEIFHSKGHPTVLIDYAHTPIALKKALLTARLHCQQGNKLWCVFGCGGDRDKGKRPLMGAIAEQYADQVIITNDNPRSEAASNIINDIKSGILNVNRVKTIPVRIDAVTSAIIHARPKDLVLVAGKGHENYQIIGQQRFKYSDRITVARLLNTIA